MDNEPTPEELRAYVHAPSPRDASLLGIPQLCSARVPGGTREKTPCALAFRGVWWRRAPAQGFFSQRFFPERRRAVPVGAAH